MMNSRKPKSLSMQIVISVIFLTGVVLLSLFFVGQRSIRMTDKTAVTQQERFAARNLGAEISRLPDEQRIVTIWDDAVLQTKAGNRKWMDDNLGVWMHEVYHHDESYVLDRANIPIYAAKSSEPASTSIFADRNAKIAPLARQLRADMAEVSAGLDNPYDELAEMSVAAILRFDDVAAIVSVVPIIADSGEISQTPGTESLHVALQYVDAELAQRIGAPIELRDVAFELAQPWSDRAGIAVTDPSGNDIAWLTWQPARPGMTQLKELLPILLAAALFRLSLLWWIVLRLLRVSRQLQVSEAQARFTANHDELTGLPNRTLFEDRLSQARHAMARTCEPVALVAIDLDRFKLINDSLGHQAGDELIRQVGSRLVELVRASDTVARFGGDEFAILLRNVTDDDQLRRFCARVVDHLSRPYELLGNTGRIGASVGAVRTDLPEDDLDELMRRADIALYRAKSDGKGRYRLFETEMGEIAQQRNRIEGDLRAALDAGTGLNLVYQPFYDVDGRMTGAEALCRWDHPEHGTLSPEIFIRVAEERGLIDQLGRQVLEQACRFTAGTSLAKIAVNVSPVQLRNPEFVPMVLDTLKVAGLAPTRLELELTEKVLLDQSISVRDSIRQLRSAGITIALDDFTTGNSSLQYLRDYRVDTVKIDRSFVKRLGSDEECEDLVLAILDLARAMGISVTVEGVETEMQHDRLAAMGCKTFQGYLLNRPMDPQRLAALIANEDIEAAASA